MKAMRLHEPRSATARCPSCGHDPCWTKCWACGWTLSGQEGGAAYASDEKTPHPVAPTYAEADRPESLTFSVAWAALASSNLRHKAGGGKAHSKKYRDSRDAIRLTATAHLKNKRIPLPAFPDGEVTMRLRFYAPDRRRRDETNYTKSLMDALNKVAYRDDSQVVEWHGSRESPDRKRPRVDVEIRRTA